MSNNIINLNTIEKNIKQIRSLFNVYLKVDTEFKQKDKYAEDDVRTVAFQKCMVCIRNMYINLKVSQENILTYSVNDLIIESGIFSMDSESIEYEYINCSKISMQLVMYSCIESTLRPIYKALNLGEESDSFSKIYKKIIRELALKDEYIKVLNILNNIRNTVHNNGVFIDYCKKNYSIEYKGYMYDFIHNEKIDSVWISNLNDLYRGLVNFYKDMFNSDKISKISNIKDRYAIYLDKDINEDSRDDLIYMNIFE